MSQTSSILRSIQVSKVYLSTVCTNKRISHGTTKQFAPFFFHFQIDEQTLLYINHIFQRIEENT